MPDLDTFDLDAAFRGLEQDIAGISSPRGSGLAVATARRRRRATVGAVAAMAVIAAGAVAAGHGFDSRDSVAPSDQLPAPAALDGAHLSAATHGWTPAWTEGTQRAKLREAQTFGGDCFGPSPGGRAGIVVLGNSHDDLAVAAMSDYGDRSAGRERDWNRVEQSVSRCSGATLVSSFSEPSGAEGHTYRIAPVGVETAPEYLWIVSTGTGIGVLKILGQSGSLPAANDRPVADALLAAVQLPASYLDTSTGSRQTLAFISAADFGEALGDWQSGWSTNAGKGGDASSPPCGAQISRSEFGTGSSLGANGDQETYGFADADAAQGAVQAFVSALRACTSASYAASTSPTSSGIDVTVAAGTGRDADVIWLLRSGSQVAYVAIPAGDSAPPTSVSTAVGELMVGPLKANASSSDTSPPGTGPVEKEAKASATKSR